MNRLWVRLAVAFVLVTWAVLAIVAGVVYRSVESSFIQYVRERDAAILGSDWIDDLANYYAATGAWAGAEPLLPASGPPASGPGAGAGHGAGATASRAGRGGVQSFIATPDGLIVVATNPAWIGQHTAAIGVSSSTPIRVDGVTVGILGQQSMASQALVEAERRFTDELNRGLLGIVLVSTLVALALGIALAYTLARPLERLAQRIAAQSARVLGAQVPVEGPTEVRAIAHAFNDMSTQLAAGEEQRRQMSSDIAHELRTPVTVLRGHLEAMMDGVYPLDVPHVATAYDQTLHLARLVDDLRLLTQAEGGRLALHLQAVAPAALVDAAAARFAPLAEDAGIPLAEQSAPNLPAVTVDIDRMQQVLDNLLTNALRHTAPGGEIVVSVQPGPLGVQIVVANSGHIPAEQLAHIFDRFWRADEARERDAGGSGLGLAITRQLIMLQHGTIRAEAGEGMTRFVIDLPAA